MPDLKKLINGDFVKNFSALSIVQVLNMIIPLVMYPFFIGSIGKDSFGYLIFNQSIVLFLVVFLSFGLNLYAVKEGAETKSKEKLSAIYSGIFRFKLILFFILLVIVYSCSHFFSQMDFNIVLLYSGIVFYELLVPVWLFQLNNNLYWLAIYTLISKLFFAILCLIFLESKNDYFLIPLFDFLSYFLLICSSMYLVLVKRKYIKLKTETPYSFSSVYHGGFMFFFGNITREIFVRTPPIIIGSFVGFSSVVYFDFAAKILSAYKTFISIVSQILYSKSVVNRSKNYIKKMLLFILFLLTLIFIIQLFFSGFLTEYFLKVNNKEIFIILTIVTSSAFFIALSNVFSVHILIPCGKGKEYARTQASALIFYSIILSYLYYSESLSLLSVSLTLLTVEVYLMFTFFYLTYPLLRMYDE